MTELKGLKLAESIKKDFVAEIDYTTIAKMKPFLAQSGASKLAEGFGYRAELVDLREYNTDKGECRITVILAIKDVETDKHVTSGVGTWDSSERGSSDRQRGMQMAYKRAYVMAIRYATYSHELFTQDMDIVLDSMPSKPQAPQAQVATSHVNTDTGEKIDVPPEMRMDDQKQALVFSRFGAKVEGKTVKECLDDADVAGMMNWILSLGSDPSKLDRNGEPQKPCSSELRGHIVTEIKKASGVSDKPDTPDIDSIAENRSERFL
tara:strand:- start:2366 stop:3157 length:792 start_codon:yes stop_codon:yes gene_type:complete